MVEEMKTRIWVTTTFEAFHKWKKAPKEVKFLQNMHRHKFHVKVELDVHHNDRELEFFMVKDKLDDFIMLYYQGEDDVGSCEMIASTILGEIEDLYGKRGISVEVSEDGENGAVVTKHGN